MLIITGRLSAQPTPGSKRLRRIDLFTFVALGRVRQFTCHDVRVTALATERACSNANFFHPLSSFDPVLADIALRVRITISDPRVPYMLATVELPQVFLVHPLSSFDPVLAVIALRVRITISDPRVPYMLATVELPQVFVVCRNAFMALVALRGRVVSGNTAVPSMFAVFEFAPD